MADHPRNSTDQPFRTLFLFHLDPKAREALEWAGFFVENALLEACTAPASAEAFPAAFAGALIEDLDALLFQLRGFLEEWTAEDAAGSGGKGLRDCLQQVCGRLKEERGALHRALDQAGWGG